MTVPDQTDASLARAASTGDLVAFEQLIRRHQDNLYRQAISYLGCFADSQDAVQDALCGAFERLPSLRDPEKVASWLRTLVRNRCLNILRARQRRNKAEALAEAAPVPSLKDTEPVDETVVHLLCLLPKASATAFRLHYMEGRTVDDIARTLETTPGSVKQRLYRARHQLRQEAIDMATTDADRLPDDFPARVIAHLIESGRCDRLHMRYDEAKEHLHHALEIQPDHPGALLELGRTYGPFGWPDDNQFGALERAARVAPDSLEVTCELAIACRQPGREDRLQAAHNRALDLSEHRLANRPDDIMALKIRARLLILDKAFGEAEHLLRRAVELSSSDQEACFWLARTLDHLDRRAEAQPLYERLCENGEGTFWTVSGHRQRATHLAFRGGDIERAVEHMEEVWRLTRWPNEAMNLIYFLGACERFDRILELYEMVQPERHHPREHATAGVAYAHRGRFEEAQAAWERVLETTGKTPIRAEASLHVARSCFELGQSDRAVGPLEIGMGLDLTDRDALAGKPSTPFWSVWTRWLVECLEALDSHGAPVIPLLDGVRQLAERRS